MRKEYAENIEKNVPDAERFHPDKDRNWFDNPEIDNDLNQLVDRLKEHVGRVGNDFVDRVQETLKEKESLKNWRNP